MSRGAGVEEGAAASVSSPLTERDRQRLVMDFNASGAPYPADRTVVDLFADQVARTPDDEAIRHGDRRLTYRQLSQLADRMAACVQAAGLGPEPLVPLFMERSIEAIVAVLGVLKAGGAYVPIDAATPVDRLAMILRDLADGMGGREPLLVTQPKLSARLKSLPPRLLVLDSACSTLPAAAATPASAATPRSAAYVIYTSGSTGTPKGVLIEHRSLVNYIWWANVQYAQGERLTWPLFSSLAFDLTVTSVFTPLISGGRLVVYGEDGGPNAGSVLKVAQDDVADIVKLTPAHLAMIKDLDLSSTRIRRFIVGGEDFKTELAREIEARIGRRVDIYNEYGPTEATVGCMIHRFDVTRDQGASVPIGRPAANAQIYILDEQRRPVPPGVIGEMYLGGDGLARGYFHRPELTAQTFVLADDPRQSAGAGEPSQTRLYKTGDLARWNAAGEMEFLGRVDHQVKVGGFRIELGEIEAALLKHADIRDGVVAVFNSARSAQAAPKRYCSRCGLASNFPGTTYDAEGVCNVCRAYDRYKDKAEAYFKTRAELEALIAEMKATRRGEYDCIVLYSGGKDSTYMLYQLVDMGVKPLVFFLDNGYISEEAKTNIRRVVDSLHVDLVFGGTPHMNEIFVDSIKHFSNVCNGCFKTIYTLATQLALEKDVRYIFTGLSRGQFFETRLTEDVFQRKDFDIAKIDALVLEARKAYHQRDDAVTCHLAADLFRDEGVLDRIQFVDFYRYWSVPLEDLYAYLRGQQAWVRPSDTGRSTNCLINDVGIYLHKKQRGFHNYSLPYSWDVRLHQKTRDEAMDELEDEIDETRVAQIMSEIGYVEPPPAAETGLNRLVAYYVSDRLLTGPELRAHMGVGLPDYMVPTYFIRLDALPLTSNGKVDRRALPEPTAEDVQTTSEFVQPRNDTERGLAAIWTELLNMESIGIHDEFFELGGHSLLAIRAVSRIRDRFGVEVPLEAMFAKPTIAGLGEAIAEAQRTSTRPTPGPGSIKRQARKPIMRNG